MFLTKEINSTFLLFKAIIIVILFCHDLSAQDYEPIKESGVYYFEPEVSVGSVLKSDQIYYGLDLKFIAPLRIDSVSSLKNEFYPFPEIIKDKISNDSEQYKAGPSKWGRKIVKLAKEYQFFSSNQDTFKLNLDTKKGDEWIFLKLNLDTVLYARNEGKKAINYLDISDSAVYISFYLSIDNKQVFDDILIPDTMVISKTMGFVSLFDFRDYPQFTNYKLVGIKDETGEKGICALKAYDVLDMNVGDEIYISHYDKYYGYSLEFHKVLSVSKSMDSIAFSYEKILTDNDAGYRGIFTRDTIKGKYYNIQKDISLFYTGSPSDFIEPYEIYPIRNEDNEVESYNFYLLGFDGNLVLPVTLSSTCQFSPDFIRDPCNSPSYYYYTITASYKYLGRIGFTIGSGGPYGTYTRSKISGFELENNLIYKEVPYPEIEFVGEESAGFLIYPNPSEGEISIKYDEDKIRPVRLSVYNNFGVILYTEAFNDSENWTSPLNIDISFLPSGIYNMLIESEEGPIYHQHFFIEK
jgi:hypothetical protein